MSKSRKPKKKNSPAAASRSSRVPILAAGLAILLIVTGGIWLAKGTKADRQAATSPRSGNPESNAPAAVATSSSTWNKLTGKWQRRDGGYVIQIKDVDAG